MRCLLLTFLVSWAGMGPGSWPTNFNFCGLCRFSRSRGTQAPRGRGQCVRLDVGISAAPEPPGGQVHQAAALSNPGEGSRSLSRESQTRRPFWVAAVPTLPIGPRGQPGTGTALTLVHVVASVFRSARTTARSALTSLLLNRSPPLVPIRCHPGVWPSEVPVLAAGYCAVLRHRTRPHHLALWAYAFRLSLFRDSKANQVLVVRFIVP